MRVLIQSILLLTLLRANKCSLEVLEEVFDKINQSEDLENPTQKTYIIGVVVQPVSDNLHRLFNKKLRETIPDAQERNHERINYFASSYMKWVTKGNKYYTVPIDFNRSHEEMEQMLNNVSGLLFPGGGTTLLTKEMSQIDSGVETFHKSVQKTHFSSQASKILKIVKGSSESMIPVFGTCLGFELLLIDSAFPHFHFELVENFKKMGNIKPLIGVKDNFISGIYESKQIESTKLDNYLYFNHRFGLPIQTFEQTPELKNNFDALAYFFSKGLHQEVPLVGVIKHKEYPFFGVQFHPEKNEYEKHLGLSLDNNFEEFSHGIAEKFTEKLVSLDSNDSIEFWRNKLQEYNAYRINRADGYDEVYVFERKSEDQLII